MKAKTEQSKDLFQKLNALNNMKEPYVHNGFGKLWCGCLINYLGGNWRHINCCGEIISFELIEDTLTMVLKCAWNELKEFRYFIEQKYPGSKLFFLNKESVMEIYTTNDREKIFFSKRFLLEHYDGVSLFESIEDAAKYVEEITGRKVDPVYEQINKAADIFFEEHNKNRLFSMSFHEFVVLDD